MAQAIVKKLINSKDSDKLGSIAAVDPKTGEVYYGKSVVEASDEGRKAKKDPKAIFFFVKVGYPSGTFIKPIIYRGNKNGKMYLLQGNNR